jgi:phage baseplate assembly protein gpV
MSGRLLDIIKEVVRQEMTRQRGSLLGVVTEIFLHESADDDHNYEVTVRLKHEDLELRRVPMAVGHIGIAVPPRVDDLVMVQFINGDLNQPVVTGRFYHADERPPLHKADDILFEQRIPDGKLNHLRFTADGTIFIQRDVTSPEDNSAALAGIKIDPDGNIEIKAGDSIIITLTNEDHIEIKADGKPIEVTCDTMTINAKVVINGDLQVSGGGTSTTISGNVITGA